MSKTDEPMAPKPVVFCGPQAAADHERIQLVRLRDAQAACYAAEGYARATGKPCLLLTFGLAEALQAASALLTAWGDKQPVVVVSCTEQSELEQLQQAFHAVARSTFLLRIESDQAALMTELAVALQGAGPVHLAVSDSLEIEPLLVHCHNSFGDGRLETSAPPAKLVERALKLLRASKRPLLLLGAGATRNMQPATAAQLARRLDCAVLLTASATTMPAERLAAFRAAFGADTLLIPSGNLVWVKALATADAVVALGTDLSETDWFGLRDTRICRGKVIRVALQPERDEQADLFVYSDAQHFAEAVLRALGSDSSSTSPSKKIAHWQRACEKWRQRLAEEANERGAANGLEPRFVIDQIVRGARDDTVFVSEGGACGMWLWSYLWLQRLVFPVQNGTIGVSIPMALGASLAVPQAPVWSVMGDGAFFYAAKELETLGELGLPLVFFVFNDASWSAIRLGQTAMFGGRFVGTDLATTDYAALAELYGCESVAVRRPDELPPAIARARRHDADVPLVIDIAITKDHVPYAGASFVLAELDGALRSVALQSATSTTLSVLRDTLSTKTLASILRMAR